MLYVEVSDNSHCPKPMKTCTCVNEASCPVMNERPVDDCHQLDLPPAHANSQFGTCESDSWFIKRIFASEVTFLENKGPHF